MKYEEKIKSCKTRSMIMLPHKQKPSLPVALRETSGLRPQSSKWEIGRPKTVKATQARSRHKMK